MISALESQCPRSEVARRTGTSTRLIRRTNTAATTRSLGDATMAGTGDLSRVSESVDHECAVVVAACVGSAAR